MNKLQQRMIAKALEVSANSDYPRVRIGAVLARKQSVIAVGWNTVRTHPKQAFYAARVGRAHAGRCHAEMAAIVKAGKNSDLRGTSMYVARYDRMGKLANCRPCPVCREAMDRRGITSFTYTTEEGVRHEQA